MQVLTLGETMSLVAPTEVAPLERADRFQVDIGGAESNVASHLALLGVSAGWASAVGDDALGRRMLATLAERGVDVSLVAVDPQAPTGVYFKDPGPAGTRVWYYRRGSAASRLGPEYAAALPLAEVPVLHVSGITPALSASCDALLRACVRARREAGLPVSFDVNHRPALWVGDGWAAGRAAELLLEYARLADLVFVGRDEAERVWGAATAEAIVDLIGPGPRVVVKDGEVGATHAADGALDFVPAERVEVVEAVGAGDAFAAGFLAAELGGGSPIDALTAGHAAAAKALTTTGDF